MRSAAPSFAACPLTPGRQARPFPFPPRDRRTPPFVLRTLPGAPSVVVDQFPSAPSRNGAVMPGLRGPALSRFVSRRRTASKPRLVTKGKGRRTAFAHREIAAELFVRFTQRASLSPRTSEKRPVDATRAAEVVNPDQARPTTRPAETTRNQERAARKPLRGTTHQGAVLASSVPRSRPCG